MKRTWILDHYAPGRLFALQVITGGPRFMVGDEYDGPAWLVLLLVAPAAGSSPAPHGSAALAKRG